MKKIRTCFRFHVTQLTSTKTIRQSRQQAGDREVTVGQELSWKLHLLLWNFSQKIRVCELMGLILTELELILPG